MYPGYPPGYPVYMQPPGQPPNPLQSMKQNLEDMEAVVRFMEDRKKKDEKPKQTWKDKKYGVVEIGTMIFISMFLGAIPVTTYILTSLADLFHKMETIFK